MDEVENLLKKNKFFRPLTSFEIELNLKDKKSRGSIYKEIKKLIGKDNKAMRIELEIPGLKKKVVLYYLKKE